MYLSKLLKDTVRLDLFKLNFSFSNEEAGYLYIDDTAKPSAKIMVRIFSFILKFIYSLFSINLNCLKKLKGLETLFFVSSKNQFDAIKIVSNLCKNYEIIGMFGFGKVQIPLFFIYLSTLFFFPLVLYNYFKSDGYKKESFRYSFDAYWLIYGIYLISRIVLKYIKPNIIVFLNDHSYENLTVHKAAKDEGVITIFIEHASVTETLKLPTLVFDYAFLEGLNSLIKYDSYGASDTKVFLVGQAKFDEYLKFRNTSSRVSKIGICVSSLADYKIATELCVALKNNLPQIQLILRPHPADPRINKWFKMHEKLRINFSNSKEESSYEFLQKVDAIISGDSNIILESVLLNVYPIRYAFSNELTDYYGFIKSGLVNNTYKNSEDLIKFLYKLINIKPIIQNNIKIYCDTIGTKYEGKSTLIILELISSLIKKENIVDEKKWVRLKEVSNLEAYRLY